MTDDLNRFVPRHAVDWTSEGHQWKTAGGTLVFVDISGFTSLSERLAALGRIGAEELTEVLDRVFGSMLDIAMAQGGTLLKFGGDALLLIFDEGDHAMHATSAAVEMRSALRQAAEIPTSVGRVSLRMSIGVHSGDIDLFNALGTHEELIVTGSAASVVTEMEGSASAGEIVVSSATRDLLPEDSASERKGGGWLLRWRTPRTTGSTIGPPDGSRPEVVTRHIPTALRDHLTGTRSDSEHRQATVAFVSVGGTDDLIKNQGGETAAEALGSLLSSITSIADAEGITFLATDLATGGIKVILVSGVPVTQEDESGRVLRSTRLIAAIDTPFSLRIGVNRGHVFSGEIGSRTRSTYTIIGDTVNLAARLMSAAAGGSIYSTPAALGGSRTLFQCKALEPFKVKGKSEPVHAVSVGEEIGNRTDSATTTLPFTGREAEFESLRTAAERAAEGHGTSITVSGPTGIGKTRLLDEALADSAAPRLEIRAEPYGTANPYRPLRDSVRDLLSIRHGPNATMLDQLLDAVKKHKPELMGLAPLLGDITHIDVGDTAESGSIEPRFRQERAIDVLIEMLDVVIEGPIVITAEDMHWSDEATTSVLDRIARETQTRPWLLITTSREAAADPSDGDLALSPLSTDEVSAIVNAATEAAPLRPEDVAILVARAGGNPLFAEELVKAAADTGDISSLPNSLDGVVGSQIDALDAAPRRVLRYVSVLGRSFRISVARELIATQGIALDSATRETLESFLDEDGDDRLQFRHAMVRDVAYEGLPFRRRQELHLGAGEILLARAGEKVDAVADLLGLHFYLGGDAARAWRFCQLAGNRAMAAYANVEAATQFERAAEVGRKLDTVNDSDLRDTWIKLGDVRERAGQFETSLEAYRKATQLTGDDSRRKAEVLLKRARAKERRGTFSSALAETTRARALIENDPTPEAEQFLGRVLGYAALIRQAQQKPRHALEMARRAATVSTDSGDEIALARAWRVMDWSYIMLGEPEKAMFSAKALEVYERLNDLDEAAGVSNNLGIISYLAGDWEEAIRYYTGGREASIRVGNLVDSAGAAANIGEVLVNQGRYEEANEPLTEARRIYAASGFAEGVAFTNLLLGRMYGINDDLAASEKSLEESISESESLGLDGWKLEAAIHLADAKCRAGSPETGLGIIENALSAAPDEYLDYYAPLIARIRGSILSSAGRETEAVEVLEHGIASASDRDDPYEQALMTLTLERVARGRTGGPSHVQAVEALRSLGVRSAPGISMNA